jgi:nucleotide-binding universal stress UspA family protein
MNAALEKPRQAAGTPSFRPHRILVAVDFSNASGHGLKYAATWAAAFDATLVLVHVVEPAFGQSRRPQAAMADMQSEAQQTARAQVGLRTLCEQLPDNCRVVETVVCRGLVFFEIVEAARTLGADLIVVSRHEHTGAGQESRGDTAEKVVRHAPCPVLVVRIPQTHLPP